MLISGLGDYRQGYIVTEYDLSPEGEELREDREALEQKAVEEAAQVLAAQQRIALRDFRESRQKWMWAVVLVVVGVAVFGGRDGGGT